MISIEEIKEKKEELNKMIEEYESQKDLNSTWDNNWKPKKDERYHFIDTFGDLTTCYNNEDTYDKKLIKHNRIFQTKELAEKWLEIDTYLREKSFEPDWNDEKQTKCHIEYDYYSREFVFDYNYNYSYFEPFYFKSEEIMEETLEKYTTEELKFYFNIGE